MSITIATTQTGVRFGLQGKKSKSPSPILFNLAGAVEEMTHEVYGEVSRRLAPHHFLAVSVDLPCHGQDPLADEPVGLPGWRFRTEQGKNIVSELTDRARAVLDYLIEEGYADPSQVFAVGTSRGGFQALHLAAAEPRIRAVAGFCPVTDLMALSEFHQHKNLELIERLGLHHKKTVQALAGRPVWLSIGNNDQRVDTDACIRFARELTRSAVEQKLPAPVELHVMQTDGHGLHPRAHEEAAAWILARL